MGKNLGLPYMGSKSAIAGRIVSILPPNDTFVDLFAGGCSVTHCAMLTDKWKRFHANDITDIPRLFAGAVSGRYHDERRWISRDTFFAEKDSEPYIRYCWSFGNNGRDYLYSRTIEPYKKACHYAVVLDDWNDFKVLCPEVWERTKAVLDTITNIKQRRVAFGSTIVKELKRIGDMNLVESNPLYKSCHWKDGKNARNLQSLERLQNLQSLERLQRLQSLESLESLERLQRLQSLESLESLERLQITQLSYDKVDIKPNSTVYADPPYANKGGYLHEFSHEDFYQWLRTREYPVYVSEYTMPSDFECVLQVYKSCSLSAVATNKTIEKVFVHKRWAKSVVQTDLFTNDMF